MSVTINFSSSVNTNGSGTLSSSYSEVGTTAVTINNQFAASSTNVLYTVSWTVASMQAIFLLATVDMTIKTNSSSTPAQTISLKAGRPLRWGVSEGYFSNPITSDVTAFYVTCTAAGFLRGYVVTS